MSHLNEINLCLPDTMGKNKKETFVLEHMRRACDAISKDIILCEKKGQILGFWSQKYFYSSVSGWYFCSPVI